MIKKILLLLISTSLILSAYSQFPLKGNYKRLSFDVYGGIPIFHGDIKNQFGNMSYSFTGRLNYNLTSVFTLGAEFSYGSMKGKDTDGDLAYFHNRYMKSVVGVDVYLFNILRFDQISRFFQPFVGIGFGAVKSDMEGSGLNGVNDIYQYNDWAYGHQYNAGVKFKLSKTFDVNLRYSIFFTNVDEIDNYNLAIPGNRHNDAFSELNLGLTMHFGKKGNEPVIWKNTEDFCSEGIDEEEEKKIEENTLTNDVIFELLAKQDSTNKALNTNLSDLKQKLSLLENKMAFMSEKTQQANSNNNDSSDPLNELEDKTYRFANGDYMYIGDLKGDISAKYYIITGSYRLNSNAKIDQINWKEKGFETYLMMEVKKGLYRVVVDYTNDHTEALRLLNDYKINLNNEAWMIKSSSK
jgi:opacity protein-like surface antigen